MRRPVSPRLAVRAALATAVAIGLAAPFVAQTARVPRVIGSLDNGGNWLIILSSGRVKVHVTSNESGQLGQGTMEKCVSDEPCAKDALVPGISDAVDAAAGAECFFVLRADGTVVAWGSNGSGRLGLSPPGTVPEFGKLPKPVPTPTQIPSLSGVRQIAAGGSFGVALLDDGTVRVWGGGTVDAANFGGATSASIHTEDAHPWTARPLEIPRLRGVTAISAGANALALLADGTVRTWGLQRVLFDGARS